MKKLLLFGLAASISLSAYSQNSRKAPGVKTYPVSVRSKPIQAQRATTAIDNQVPYRSKALPMAGHPAQVSGRSSSLFTETVIGKTIYDLQSNRGTAKRITNNLDGTLSAVWTMTPIGGTNGVDRGTGYNYFDGTSWGALPTARIEAIRTGFTNLDYTPQAGEYVAAHTTGSSVNLTRRPVKGIGAWTEDTVGTFNKYPLQADVWARMALGGGAANSVHVIVNSQGTGTTPVLAQNGPLTYSRSLDGGLTWIDDHIQIPGTDSSFMFGVGAEEYHVDAKGDVIAVVTGGFTLDVTLFKSLDNGATWTKTVVSAFPLGQPYDPTTQNTDTTGDGLGEIIPTNAGDVTVTIDHNNICHLAWGDMSTVEDAGATNESFFPTSEGLWYWHEGMGAPMMVASTQDFNNNGFIDIPTPADTVNDSGFGLYNTGFSCQPSIGIDGQNRIFIAYADIDERADTTAWQQAMRHVFVIGSADGGANWSTPMTVNPAPDGDFQEAVWPSVATEADGCIHIVYQRDPAPGHSLSNNPTQAANNLLSPSDIVYACVTPAEVLGMNENTVSSTAWVTANYPNPAKDFTTINVTLNQTSDVSLEITNLVGQVMFSDKQNGVVAGMHSIRLDVSHLDAGVYFYNVTAGDQKVSRKMIVQ